MEKIRDETERKIWKSEKLKKIKGECSKEKELDVVGER